MKFSKFAFAFGFGFTAALSLMFQVSAQAEVVPAAKWDGNVVFYITGGPIKAQPGNIHASGTALRERLEGSHPGIYFEALHNTQWKKICDSIREKRSANPNVPAGKIITVGHSYGASATSRLADCLAEAGYEIDLAVHMDMIRRPTDSHPDTVRANIQTALNFYQTQDMVLRGRKVLKRLNGSQEGIINAEVDGELGGSPHFGVVTRLMVETDIIEDSILAVLKN